MATINKAKVVITSQKVDDNPNICCTSCRVKERKLDTVKVYYNQRSKKKKRIKCEFSPSPSYLKKRKCVASGRSLPSEGRLMTLPFMMSVEEPPPSKL